ncbi:MAG TPA: TorF family putative porin [Hydrogenophaga sp.]|nr:TorF family putative porin [Hydrogenophaga sp.]
MKKNTRPAAVLAAMLLVTAALPAAAEGLSFNVGLVSLYKFNGIDQNASEPRNVRPAVQGGVDYDFGNGFYAGNWNSTGKFGNESKAKVEIDLYGGYRGEFGEGWRYDVGVIRFIYPRDNSWNANEWYVRLGHGIFSAQYGHGFGNGNKTARLQLSLAQPLGEKLTLDAGVGFRNRHNMDGANDAFVGLTYDLGAGLIVSGRISGAETDKVGDAGKARLVASLIKAF